MKIALCQLNPVIGDFAGNRARVLAMARRASAEGCDLAVFPELCLCGYPPMDLLEHGSFVAENLASLESLSHELPLQLAVMVGYVGRNAERTGRGIVNAVSLLVGGAVRFTQAKTLLPTYDVFDEARWFEPAAARRVFPFRGERIGTAICEDIWWEGEEAPGLRYAIDPVAELAGAGATIIISPSASPFYRGKAAVRLGLLAAIGRKCALPTIYVNTVGANDSLIFDGRSMATSASGSLVYLARAFEEDFGVVDTRSAGPEIPLPQAGEEEIEQALVLGIRDYAAKCGFKRAHVGVSGGIDSALVATLAVKALGPERVAIFAMPSRYSSPGSLADARSLACNLGIELGTLPIEGVFSAYLSTLEPAFASMAPDVTEENLQARVRGTLLMAYANKFHSLLLATGNKSELATGYCTLYGDMCGGLAPIGDLLKTEVYALSGAINARRPLIPEASITKAPSAELKPDQTDQDTLPPYVTLDGILERYLVRGEDPAAIAAGGYDAALVRSVTTMVERAEYKRRQAPPVLKVSPKAFGMGRRIPIARKI